MSEDYVVKLFVGIVAGGLLYLVGMFHGIYFARREEFAEAKKIKRVRKEMADHTGRRSRSATENPTRG